MSLSLSLTSYPLWTEYCLTDWIHIEVPDKCDVAQARLLRAAAGGDRVCQAGDVVEEKEEEESFSLQIRLESRNVRGENH